jgi:hypothetical protein
VSGKSKITRFETSVLYPDTRGEFYDAIDGLSEGDFACAGKISRDWILPKGRPIVLVFTRSDVPGACRASGGWFGWAALQAAHRAGLSKRDRRGLWYWWPEVVYE